MLTYWAGRMLQMSFFLSLTIGVFGNINHCWAEGVLPGTTMGDRASLMKIVAGKSQVINTPVAITRASIANPEVADTVVLSPRQLYVVGKQVGATNLTLWDDRGQVLSIYDIEIAPDLDRLRQQIQHLLPDENKITIESSHDFVTISGKVTSSARLKEVLTIAEAYAPHKVINLLEVDREVSPPVTVDVIKGISVGKVEF